MAESLGFHTLQSDDTLLDRLMQESGGEGYDFVFDCAGHQSVADILPDVVKIRGKIEIVAGYKKPPMMNYQKGMFREFSIQFTRVYTFKDFKIAAGLAAKEPMYEKLINYELPAEEAKHGFELLTTPTDAVLDLFDISGRYAVVTGANRGLGLGIAEGFAKAGANLVLISRTMPEEVLEKLRAHGVEVANFHCDFSQPQTIAPLVKDILARYPKIDILVNVAGTQRRNACVDFTDEDWDFVHAVNEKSPFILCREFGRHMVANHYGKIINFASLLSYQGGLRVPAYAASKGAVMQFTKSLANEWSKDNVNVNCIVPGYYATEMNTALLNDPVRNEQITVRIPAGRWGQPEDLVGAAIFLASHASDYVDGIALPVDGGWLGR